MSWGFDYTMTDKVFEDYDLRFWLEKGRLYYLGCPFTGDEAEEEGRGRGIAKIASDLYARGHEVFSPICHGKAMAEAMGTATDWEYWERLDIEMLSRCDALLIVPLPGWRRSVGLYAEAGYAFRHEMPVFMLDMKSVPDGSCGAGAIAAWKSSDLLWEFETEGEK